MFCLDIPECLLGSHDCHVNATCRDVPGSFECTCNEGFTGDGRDCQGYYTCGAMLSLTPLINRLFLIS